MRAAAVLRISDCITGSVWSAIQEPTGWQRIGNYIDDAFVFARTDCVNMHSGWLRTWLAGMRSSD
jgi:hypothetical protein